MIRKIRTRIGLCLVAVLATVAPAVIGATLPAQAVTGPFGFGTYSGGTLNWCPDYLAGSNLPVSGCNVQQNPVQFPPPTVTFDPGQVVFNAPSNRYYLKINSGQTLFGSMNTDTQETFAIPFTYNVTALWPCDANSHNYNWPAIWLISKSDKQEIDLVEGLAPGVREWHFHYGTDGSQSVGGTPTFTGTCGVSYKYTVDVDSTLITWTWAGTVVESLTAASVGLTSFSGPWTAVIDYRGGTPGGPASGSRTMQVSPPTETSG